jgi:hypothetical protein
MARGNGNQERFAKILTAENAVSICRTILSFSTYVDMQTMFSMLGVQDTICALAQKLNEGPA